MKNIDFLTLDGRSLRTFLVVLEEMSISEAANRLGVTQSAVSHLLDKLRLTLGDPLFVRSGRGIAPTERAIALRKPVQEVLDGLKALTNKRVFDPSLGELEFTIAANDFQRELIFPELLRRITAKGVATRFRFIPAGIPAANLLRQARCQLLITPFPPDGPDIYQLRLFEDTIVCFYDAEQRSAPTTREAFATDEFIEVRFDDNESAMHIIYKTIGITMNKPRITVPNFSALPAFLRDSNMLCTTPRLMKTINLQDFTYAPLPFKSDRMIMYMVWHRRDHLDPAHQWLRNQIKTFANERVQEE